MPASRSSLRSLVALALGLTLLAPADLAVAQGPPGGAPPSVTVAKPLVRDIVEYSDFTGRF
ncbi:MAG: efflux transporter periplasmic adaptor subunit, partial [Methylobacteriaceae bacterium]|nr:efflux transporter periplasmic adaptor subunit [Methylobacteriaceae bacterium]